MDTLSQELTSDGYVAASAGSRSALMGRVLGLPGFAAVPVFWRGRRPER